MSLLITYGINCWLLAACFAKVIELDENFLEQANQETWLVNFYAPWCGHCKRLAPIYNEVGQSLRSLTSAINVGRLDASSFTSLGRKFDIRGFPTLVLIDHGSMVKYEGERSVRSIVSFALRAYGSAVKPIVDSVEFAGNATFFADDPFFVLIDAREHTDLNTTFHIVAEQFRFLTWFLSAPLSAISPNFTRLIEQFDVSGSNVLVFKDNQAHAYSGAAEPNSLSRWVSRERSPTFARFRTIDLWDFGASELLASNFVGDDISSEGNGTFRRRLLALFLVDRNDAVSESFFHLGRSLAEQRLNGLNRFQFGWSDSFAELSELAVHDLAVPSLIVVDPVTEIVYLNPNQTTVNGLYTDEPGDILRFLLAVLDGHAMAFGGDSFFVKLRRLGRRFSSELLLLVTLHPLVSLIVFSIPATLLCGIAYLCCCMDERFDETSCEVVPGKFVGDHPGTCGVADTVIETEAYCRSTVDPLVNIRRATVIWVQLNPKKL